MREEKKKPKAEADKKLSAPTIMEGADIFDARQALRHGNEAPIGWYLQDEAKKLRFISNSLDPTSQHQKVRLVFLSDRPGGLKRDRAGSTPDEEQGWVGSPPQTEAASKAQLGLATHLRNLGDFLESLALPFDPPQGSRGWRLRFKREGRGRPRDQTAEMLNRDAVLTMLKFETIAAGKQEAAIEALKKMPGASRASLFRKKAARLKRR